MKVVIGLLGLVAVLGAATACASQVAPNQAGAHAPVKAKVRAPASSRGPLYARIILPSRTIKAGSAMKAQLVVENNTGHVIHESACGGPFALEFTSRTYHPIVASPTCLQVFTIAKGQTRYRMGLVATYNQCGNDGASYASPACLPHGRMPPLPSGKYRVELFQLGHVVPAPPAIPVTITPMH